MERIYIIEDDENIRNLLKIALEGFGYAAEGFETAEEGLARMREEKPDLVIFDWMLPGMDGTEAIKEVRNTEQLKYVPIMLLTAKEKELDKVVGLDCGADDYMVKPIDINEMILRVGALLRRSKMASEHSLTVGNCVLDYDAMSVAVDGGAAETIPQMEFKLLFKLLSYPDKIFTRRQLLDELWGMDKDVDERTVDVHVKRLRERYGSCESFDIVTVRGLGYKAVKKQ